MKLRHWSIRLTAHSIRRRHAILERHDAAITFSGRPHIRELDDPDPTAKALTESLKPPLLCYEQGPERPQEEPNPWRQILFSTDVF
jgi:hypothetical protein